MNSCSMIWAVVMRHESIMTKGYWSLWPRCLSMSVTKSWPRYWFELAEETGLDVMAAGSTTFKRKSLRKGAEPDASFYIRNIDRVGASAQTRSVKSNRHSRCSFHRDSPSSHNNHFADADRRRRLRAGRSSRAQQTGRRQTGGSEG